MNCSPDKIAEVQRQARALLNRVRQDLTSILLQHKLDCITIDEPAGYGTYLARITVRSGGAVQTFLRDTYGTPFGSIYEVTQPKSSGKIAARRLALLRVQAIDCAAILDSVRDAVCSFNNEHAAHAIIIPFYINVGVGNFQMQGRLYTFDHSDVPHECETPPRLARFCQPVLIVYLYSDHSFVMRPDLRSGWYETHALENFLKTAGVQAGDLACIFEEKALIYRNATCKSIRLEDFVGAQNE